MLIFSETHVRRLLGAMPEETEEWLLSLKRRLTDDGMPTVSRLRMLDAETYMPGSILAKVDRMSMQHSLEVRSPLLSVEVAKFAERLHPDACYREGQGKVVLKRLGERYMPRPWLMRRKTGFGLPLSWAQAPLRDLAARFLSDEDAAIGSIVNRGALTALLGPDARGDVPIRRLWSVLILETWLRSHPARSTAALSPLTVSSPAARGPLDGLAAQVALSVIPSRAAADLGPLTLKRLHPASTRAGHGFNVQPNGDSALAIVCENAIPTTVAFLDDTALETTYGGPTFVTAVVPAPLFSEAGVKTIRLVSRYWLGELRTDVSDAMRFDVE
jgi:hypothetical protein